jgi:dihydropteroate synthase
MNRIIHSNIPILMGIVNVTPDSFSDGGQYLNPEKAIAHGFQLVNDGAAILDIGGESTRPGAAPVHPEEEIARVVPVIEGLKNSGAVISIDTRHAKTMEAALKAGASLINDVTALEGSLDSLRVAAESDAIVSLMHMKGIPQSMQDAPWYDDVLVEVYDYLGRRIEACMSAGISQDRIMIDPGIGFGKTLEHNLILLKNIRHFQTLGVPVLLGASRKSFIGKIYQDVSPEKRLPGSLASVLAAYQQGVRLFRVHDVAETAQALKVFNTLSD